METHICLQYFYVFLFTLQAYIMHLDSHVLVYFQDACHYDVETVINGSEVPSLIKNEFEYITVCNVTETSMYHYYLNSSIDVFVGPVNYTLDQVLLKHALLFHRPYISPYSPLHHFDNQQIFSIGTGFEQTAMAVVTIMNHFQWRNIVILTALDENWMELGSVIFIYLSSDGFSPNIKYIRHSATDNEIQGVLEEIEHKQKAILLCTEISLRTRILETAADRNMHVHHAFFTFVMSPYTLHTADSHALKSPEHKHILESIFEIHPDFIESTNVTRLRRHTYDIQLEYNYIFDSVLLLDQAFSTFPSHAAVDLDRLFEGIRNSTLGLHSGKVVTDVSNEILYDFVLYDFDAVTMKYVKVQEVIQAQDGSWKLLGIADLMWPKGIALPPDECFFPDSCMPQASLDPFYIVAIAISVLVVAGISTAVVITVWRNVIKKEMSKGHHKILLTSEDLVFLQRKDVQKGSKDQLFDWGRFPKTGSHTGLIYQTHCKGTGWFVEMINGLIPDKPDILKASEKPNRSMASLHEYSDITDTARYNGDLVHVKELKVKGFEMKSKVLTIIKTLREIRHENVNAIIGFFEEQTSHFIISDYCNRGSLEDVIKNTDIKLDWDFKVSLLTDLIRGIRFVQNSALRYHGNLKWQNCVIDSRWVLKVTDFGLPSIYEASKCSPECDDLELLFVAPEHLRMPNPLLKGSEKGDVYSMAIIMQSVILRSAPFSMCGLSPKEIIQKLRHPPPLLRPSVSQQAAPPQYIQIMKVCWSENPDMRPSVEEIYQQYKTITGGKKLNIVDTMFRMLEKYSTDLEDLVRERTTQLEDEKKKTDTLLYRMLPPIVADNLKIGRTVQAETFSQVTIYFSDIVGFTTISAMSTPMEVVALLNDLYTMFDAVIDNFDVYKVETIGDAYMVVSGLPVRNGNRHAGEISTMALELLSHCGNFVIKHMPEVPLRVRIGLHSGSCVAGVVGLTMPRYCLFGDTVNTASRMESTGAPYRIHISEDLKVFLDDLTGYRVQYRGEVELKGKGMAKTYWLTGKEGFIKTLPEPSPLDGLSLKGREGAFSVGKTSTEQEKDTQVVKGSGKMPVRQITLKEMKEKTATTSISEDSKPNIEQHEPASNVNNSVTSDKSSGYATDKQSDEFLIAHPQPALNELAENSEVVSVSKTSTSAIYVSVIDQCSTTTGDTSIQIQNTAGPSYTLGGKESSLTPQTSVSKSEDNVSESDNNNDRYFHEIESYFRDENVIPAVQTKLYKTTDSRRVKRTHSAHEGGTSHTYHNKNGDSKVTSHTPDVISSLTSVENISSNRIPDSHSKPKLYAKKGSRHKIYDNTVRVAEQKRGEKISLGSIHSKRKLRERQLSDVPSSRLCSPEPDDTNSDSQDSLNEDTPSQTGAKRISLKLPLSESLV